MFVLIIESDLGFVFWLGHALDKAGYPSLPAKNVQDATSLIRDLNLTVGLLIVNPRLPGSRALADAVRASASATKVIAVVEPREVPSAELTFADGYKSKPVIATETAKQEWLAVVEGLLAREVVALNEVTTCQPASQS